MKNDYFQTTGNSIPVCNYEPRKTWVKNNNINIEGKKVCYTRKNYYAKYYTRINNVYVVDYRDKQGRLLYRAIYIIPKKIRCEGQKYLGAKSNKNQIK